MEPWEKAARRGSAVTSSTARNLELKEFNGIRKMTGYGKESW
jgi:hypothetical protein